jgi:hypothetical protein
MSNASGPDVSLLYVAIRLPLVAALALAAGTTYQVPSIRPGVSSAVTVPVPGPR